MVSVRAAVPLLYRSSSHSTCRLTRERLVIEAPRQRSRKPRGTYPQCQLKARMLGSTTGAFYLN